MQQPIQHAQTQQANEKEKMTVAHVFMFSGSPDEANQSQTSVSRRHTLITVMMAV